MVLPCLIQNLPTQNCFAPQREDFSIDFEKGGRRRIGHTARTHLLKDTEKPPLRLVYIISVWLRYGKDTFEAGSYYSCLAMVRISAREYEKIIIYTEFF